MEEKNIQIRFHVLFPIGLVLLCLCIGAAFAFRYFEKRHIETYVDLQIDNVQRYLALSQKDDTGALDSRDNSSTGKEGQLDASTGWTKTLAEVRRLFDVRLICFLDKQYLSKADFADNAPQYNRIRELIPPRYAICGSLGMIDSLPLDRLPLKDTVRYRNNYFGFTFDRHEYAGRLVSLLNPKNEPIGFALVLVNIGKRSHHAEILMLYIFILSFIFPGFLMVLFWVYLNPVESYIQKLQSDFEAEEVRHKKATNELLSTKKFLEKETANRKEMEKRLDEHVRGLMATRESDRKALKEAKRENEKRKKAEAELRGARNFLNTIINAIPNPICVQDDQLRWLIVNDAFCELSGKKREDLIGTIECDIFPKDSAIEIQELDEKSMESLIPYEREVTFVDKDGNQRHALIQKTAYKLEHGSRILIGIITDVTELTRAQIALRNREANLKLAQELAHVGSWEWNLKENCLTLSDEAYHILGVDKSTRFTSVFEMIDTVIHPEDAGWVKQKAESFGEDASNEPFVYRVSIPDNDIRWISATLPEVTRRSPDGKPEIVIGTIQDITEQIEARDKLLRFKAAMEQSVDGIALTDLDGFIEFVNPAWARMHGYEVDEIIGKHLSLFHTEEQFKSDVIPFGDTVMSEGSNEGEVGHVTKDGTEFIAWMSASVLLDENGQKTGIIGIARDITDQKYAEEELTRYAEDLRLAKEFLEQNSANQNKLLQELNEARIQADEANQAKSTFLANMSHEIRTPMNAIIGMTQLALDTRLDEQQRQYLEMVQSSADNLLQIINSILDFSKIEAGQMFLEHINFSLRDEIHGAIKPLAIQAQSKGLELISFIDPLVPDNVIGDPGRLRQILINLLGNAIKFTQEGHIILRGEIETIDEQVFFHFSVSDTGIGIPKEKQDKIFESFTQADGSTTRNFGGTGLGTTIAKQLTEMMGGKIWLESPTNTSDVGGSGSTFHVIIKLSVNKDKARTIALESKALYGKRVLVADANEASRVYLKTLLEHWDMKPTLVETGQEAIGEVQRTNLRDKPYHLIILDYAMPDKDGCETAAYLHERGYLKKSAVLLTSAASAPLDMDQVKESGIIKVIMKPIDDKTLYNDIVRAFSEEGDGEGTMRTERDLAGNGQVDVDGTGLRVLLAEDNNFNVVLAKTLLEKHGFEVIVVGNGQEAYDAAVSDDYDIILMDVQMPIMGGFEATQKIREYERTAGKHRPIIAMTAHALQGDREKCLNAGMDEYISKPLNPEKLFSIIGRFVTGKKRQVSKQKAIPQAAQADIDLDKLYQAAGGDDELVMELIRIFLEQSPRLFNDIQQAINESDAELLCRSAHTFKGSAANMGAETIAKTAFALEKMGKEEDFSNSQQTLNTLKEQYKGLEKALKEKLEQSVV